MYNNTAPATIIVSKIACFHVKITPKKLRFSESSILRVHLQPMMPYVISGKERVKKQKTQDYP